jgi:hypothetical protein
MFKTRPVTAPFEHFERIEQYPTTSVSSRKSNKARDPISETPYHSERAPMFKTFKLFKTPMTKKNLFEHSEHIEQPPATFRQWRRKSVRITRLGGGAVMPTIPSTYPNPSRMRQ